MLRNYQFERDFQLNRHFFPVHSPISTESNLTFHYNSIKYFITQIFVCNVYECMYVRGFFSSIKCYLSLFRPFYSILCVCVFKLSRIFRLPIVLWMTLKNTIELFPNNEQIIMIWMVTFKRATTALYRIRTQALARHMYRETERQKSRTHHWCGIRVKYDVLIWNSHFDYIFPFIHFFFLLSFSFILYFNGFIIACRYDKGEWSKCVNGSISRKDNVRTGSDASCKQTRDITKSCNKDKKQKKQDKSKLKKSITFINWNAKLKFYLCLCLMI